MAIGDPFLMGVNYWPRKKAMYWWADFDAGEVREEFAMIAELGLTHVRFFLLWESFQPTPTMVSSKALADLRTVCDIAAELGLKLQPTFFTGHMSGPNWKLEDDRKSVTLSLPTEPPASIQLDAAGVEDALNKLGEFRAAMSPVIPVTYEMGQKIDAIVHPIWATETEVTLGDTVLP